MNTPHESRASRAPRRGLAAVAATFALFLCTTWQVVAPPAAHAAGPTTFINTTPLTIPGPTSSSGTGPASPYPSNIAVSGMPGLVTSVSVTFHGLNHESLGDIDALLVAPNGANIVVFSDTDPATAATSADLTFADEGATLPSSGNVVSGTYQPTNSDIGGPDSFPAPAPAPSDEARLIDAFSGIDPNGTWSLYVVDDAVGDSGSMAGGWSLTITTAAATEFTTTVVTTSNPSSHTGDTVTFTATSTNSIGAVIGGAVQFTVDGVNAGAPVPVDSNGTASLTTSSLTEGNHLVRAEYSGAPGFQPSAGTVTQRVDNPTVKIGQAFCNLGGITIPSSGPAVQYPSNILVSGLSGTITHTTVMLHDLSHASPLDLDILLSGPDPAENIFLMSDTGGLLPLSNVDLTFDDSADGPIPSPAVSGTYLPTNESIGAADDMPSPAPTPSSTTSLAVFNGSSPNGVWSLWVVDNATLDSGSIPGGWCIQFTTENTSGTGGGNGGSGSGGTGSGDPASPSGTPTTPASGVKSGALLSATGDSAQSPLRWVGLGLLTAGLLAISGSFIRRRRSQMS